MKKSGFSIIESIVAIAVVLILLLGSFIGFKYYKVHIEKLENLSAVYDVKEFLSFCKKFCYNNETSGEVYFDCCDKFSDIYLVAKGKVVKVLDISGKLKISNCNCVSGGKRVVRLKINDKGYIDPFTIKIDNENYFSKEIIIQVGGNLIYIKDE